MASRTAYTGWIHGMAVWRIHEVSARQGMQKATGLIFSNRENYFPPYPLVDMAQNWYI